MQENPGRVNGIMMSEMHQRIESPWRDVLLKRLRIVKKDELKFIKEKMQISEEGKNGD